MSLRKTHADDRSPVGKVTHDDTTYHPFFGWTDVAFEAVGAPTGCLRGSLGEGPTSTDPVFPGILVFTGWESVDPAASPHDTPTLLIGGNRRDDYVTVDGCRVSLSLMEQEGDCLKGTWEVDTSTVEVDGSPSLQPGGTFSLCPSLTSDAEAATLQTPPSNILEGIRPLTIAAPRSTVGIGDDVEIWVSEANLSSETLILTPAEPDGEASVFEFEVRDSLGNLVPPAPNPCSVDLTHARCAPSTGRTAKAVSLPPGQSVTHLRLLNETHVLSQQGKYVVELTRKTATGIERSNAIIVTVADGGSSESTP